MTSGGRAYPAVLEHPRTVIWDLFPNPTAHEIFMARFATICSGEGSSGIQVSSALNICEGLSSSSLSTKFLLQYIEVLT